MSQTPFSKPLEPPDASYVAPCWGHGPCQVLDVLMAIVFTALPLNCPMSYECIIYLWPLILMCTETKQQNVHYTSMAGPLTTQIPKRCKIDSCLFMTFIWRCRPALTYISFSSTDDVHSAMQSKFSRHMYLQFLAPGHFWACYCVGAPVSKTWLEGHTVTQTHIHVFLHVQMTHTSPTQRNSTPNPDLASISKVTQHQMLQTGLAKQHSMAGCSPQCCLFVCRLPRSV